MNTKIFLLFISLVLLGCNLEEINENPNVPANAPLSTLLPPAQKGLADAQGRRTFRYTGIFAKQLVGVEGQELLIQSYQPDELFVGNMWQDYYADGLLNLEIIIQRASLESPHYAGVARVLTAHGLGILTDIWGDVPYSEAFLKGPDQANPGYDSQELIYATIDGLLEQALVDLQADNSIFSPGPDDLMYGGDLNSWIRAASVLRARYAIHTTQRNPNAASEALEALNLHSMSAPGDDLLYPYLGTGDDTNPIAGFYQITPLAYMNPSFLALISDLDDPRESTISRSIPFSGGNRKPGDYWAVPSAPVRLVTFIEQEFIRAEALLRNGDIGGAQDALELAVRTSMDEISAGAIEAEEADAYIDAHVQLSGSFENNLQVLMTQKYIAMLTTFEPWTDWRRTGYPELTPNSGGVTSANPNGEIPRRLIYPQSERLRNTNFPLPAPNMQTRFWWDME